VSRAYSRTILLDTSFILALTRGHRQLVNEVRDASIGRVRLATSEGVIMELERLARNGQFPSKALAKLALDQLKDQDVEIRETFPAVSGVDTGVLVLALGDRDPLYVATVDHRLGETLSKLGINVISPRKKGGLTVKPATSSSLK
jgi:rRNA-processing protein FCF1